MSDIVIRRGNSISDSVEERGRRALAGQRKGIRALLPFMGPALIAAVAYVDPGNYATNIQAGAAYGVRLLWVVVLANLMAMVIQTLSAKLGIATGRNLPELCRAYYPKWVSVSLWLVAEAAAMATDVAEFLGASLGLNLLLHIPLLAAALITGIVTYGILTLERFGWRPLEIFIGALLFVIALCYIVEVFFAKPQVAAALHSMVVPWLGGSNSILLATGIVGATVMPHAVYLHSGLTQGRIRPRSEKEAAKIYRFEKFDVLIAMVLAGLVNIAMVYVASSAFHNSGHMGIASIETAYHTLTPLLGAAAAGVFLISLLASGLSSSAVGTMAGQVIMQGFVGFQIPVWVRRVVTMVPTLVIVAIGVEPTKALVLSQVALSMALPAPLISLMLFTKNKQLMGRLVNPRWITALLLLMIVVIVGLNVLLLYYTL